MQVWLTEAQYAFAFFGLLALLLIAPWVRLQFRRFGRFRGWPAVVSTAVVLYGCALIAFTMYTEFYLKWDCRFRGEIAFN